MSDKHSHDKQQDDKPHREQAINLLRYLSNETVLGYGAASDEVDFWSSQLPTPNNRDD